MKQYAPDAYFVFHDAFHPAYTYWEDLFDKNDRSKVAVDHHHFTEFGSYNFVWMACFDITQKYRQNAAAWKANGYEVWIGEWSLATDTCATWLGGLNDGYNHMHIECKPVLCPKSYMPYEFDTSFPRFNPSPLLPHSTNTMRPEIGIVNGVCWDDSEFFSDEDITIIAKCHYDVFES
jgi:hypothetical protein